MGLARVRRTRIDQLVDEGNKAAKLVQNHLEDPDRFISACQLGITLATLALGAAGEASFADKLAALFEHWGSLAAWSPEVLHFARLLCFGVSFVITAFCQTVFGELIPKTWTFQRAESVLFLIIYPMEWWCWLASPFISS